jgi:hypothetical protein
MRRARQRYDFDNIVYNKNVIETITNSCITSQKTIEILLKNSSVFRPSAFRQIEINGIAKFEFLEKQRLSIFDLLGNIGG